jgi:hypothetical protein
MIAPFRNFYEEVEEHQASNLTMQSEALRSDIFSTMLANGNLKNVLAHQATINIFNLLIIRFL